MFERILLALDDSPAGEVATAFTGALAQRAGADTSVHVIHVNERLVGDAASRCTPARRRPTW